MTPLRRRMTGDLQLRRCSDRTVEAGVHAVAQLALFYGTSPDRLSEEQVRDYLLHLSTVQHVAASTHTIALRGITFFHQRLTEITNASRGAGWILTAEPSAQ